VGIIARVIKHTFEKFITLTGETRKDFNFNTLLYTPAGDDSIPLENERLILAKVDGTGKYVTVGVLTPSQGAKPGEKILFARDKDGKVVSKLSFLKDGTVKLEAEKDLLEEIKGKKSVTVKGDKTEDIQGKFYFGNTAQNMAKLLIGLIDEIIAIETFGPPPKHKIMPTTVTKLEAYKNQVKALLKESV
jgi:uncharacterized protein YjhX (UPF0386 family)